MCLQDEHSFDLLLPSRVSVNLDEKPLGRRNDRCRGSTIVSIGG